ncbi:MULTISPECIES: hypothetical protein [unclassified Streptomyces]|uniref:hypothetical protein n=1 Tax=unclassified Streptomyces TaxID=2593676 RepID=UPI002DDA18D3|nr:hypothetical protein [Streptomyces sp. NBC_01294]WRZ56518.1 hypothetical protein OG534_08520 [Streptomyces sp. NBC_01294]
MTAVLAEKRLGDPLDPANPLGFDAILAADERREPFTAADDVLRGPLAERSGRDRLVELGRAVFRRDTALAARLGVPGLAAVHGLPRPPQAAPFAVAADAGLRVADGILNGRAHVLGPDPHGYAVLGLRTDDGTPARLLLDLATLPSAHVHRGPARKLIALEGSAVAEYTFHGCPLPGSGVLDLYGPEVPALLSGMAVGAVDSQLRLALDFAHGRMLYGRRVTDIPHSGNLLAGVFLDVLICDGLAGLPGASALVHDVVRQAGNELTVLLGARSYLREGPHGIFQKQLRDLPALLHLAALPDASAPAPLPRELPAPDGLADAVRRRLGTRFGHRPQPLDDTTRRRVLDELLARADAGLTFDLACTALPRTRA